MAIIKYKLRFFLAFCLAIVLAYSHWSSYAKSLPGNQATGSTTMPPAKKTFLDFFYTNKVGSKIRPLLTFNGIASGLAGFYCNRAISAKHIKPFIKKNAINMAEAQKKVDEFTSFNDFFTRKLKPNARPIDSDHSTIISPADCAVTVIQNCTRSVSFPVKQSIFNLERFFGDAKLAKEFQGGTLMVFRLAPADYHRFHFPCDCTPSKPRIIHGHYESVNPLVYLTGIQPLTENERHITLLETTCYGNVALVSVGALCVGQIKETYTANKEYKKGDEAGYFCFGGSTVVLVFKSGTITVNPELLKKSAQEHYGETPIKMGQVVATTNIQQCSLFCRL